MFCLVHGLRTNPGNEEADKVVYKRRFVGHSRCEWTRWEDEDWRHRRHCCSCCCLIAWSWWRLLRWTTNQRHNCLPTSPLCNRFDMHHSVSLHLCDVPFSHSSVRSILFLVFYSQHTTCFLSIHSFIHSFIHLCSFIITCAPDAAGIFSWVCPCISHHVHVGAQNKEKLLIGN